MWQKTRIAGGRNQVKRLSSSINAARSPCQPNGQVQWYSPWHRTGISESDPKSCLKSLGDLIVQANELASAPMSVSRDRGLLKKMATYEISLCIDIPQEESFLERNE
ncbi:hypothetical protein BDL97_12G098600 [Sphagnum fallax]|nr:hypothetical protein BDL97_12G098600 [Sphagnum fallax]